MIEIENVVYHHGLLHFVQYISAVMKALLNVSVVFFYIHLKNLQLLAFFLQIICHIVYIHVNMNRFKKTPQNTKVGKSIHTKCLFPDLEKKSMKSLNIVLLVGGMSQTFVSV